MEDKQLKAEIGKIKEMLALERQMPKCPAYSFLLQYFQGNSSSS
ncbi:MAG: hypothetical protein ACI8RA_002763 [Chlamydiales bacterium]|jgi:hypothetical protein